MRWGVPGDSHGRSPRAFTEGGGAGAVDASNAATRREKALARARGRIRHAACRWAPAMTTRRPPSLLLVLLLVCLPVPAARGATEEERIAWRSASALPGMREGEALAFDPASGRIALGDARGVWLLEAEGTPRRALGRGPVRDLRFRAGGELLAATDRGLFAIGADGRVRFLRLGGGKASRARRVAVAEEAIAAGTEDGVFLARDGATFARLGGGLPGGVIDALALRPADGGLELWTASKGALYRALVREDGAARTDALLADRAGGTDVTVETPAISDGPVARTTVDLAVDLGGAEVVALAPEHLAAFRDGAWRTVPLQLPAGTRARRIGAAAGRLWVATDGGVADALRLEGPWRRAEPPAGGAPALAVAGDDARVFALGVRGLLAGAAAGGTEGTIGAAPARERLPGALAPGDYLHRLRTEPTVRQVHEAALLRQRLGPERLRSLERGVDSRGWLPDLEIRGGYGKGRSVRWFEDQAQSSGAIFDLLDRERDHGSDWDAAVLLRWSLGDLAFAPDSLDVSREAREVDRAARRDARRGDAALLRAPPRPPRAARRPGGRRRVRAAPPPRRRARRRARRVDRRLVFPARAATRGRGLRSLAPLPARRRHASMISPVFRRTPHALVLVLALAAGRASALPVISEVLYDATGSDDGALFVELYGAPGSSVEGWVIEGVNGADGEVTHTLALAGTFPVDGILVIADESSGGGTLVPGADLLGSFDLQNGPDSVVLRDAGGVVVDALGYGVFDPGSFFAGEGSPAADPPRARASPGSSPTWTPTTTPPTSARSRCRRPARRRCSRAGARGGRPARLRPREPRADQATDVAPRHRVAVAGPRRSWRRGPNAGPVQLVGRRADRVVGGTTCIGSCAPTGASGTGRAVRCVRSGSDRPGHAVRLQHQRPPPRPCCSTCRARTAGATTRTSSPTSITAARSSLRRRASYADQLDADDLPARGAAS